MTPKSYVPSHLRNMNRSVVFNTIAEGGPTSKAEIIKKTGISPPTTIKIVNYLIERQLVLEAGEGESQVGRKPHLLTLNRDLFYVASFFFEGEFLTYGIVDITYKVVHKKHLRCSPCLNDIMARIEGGLVEELFEEKGIPLAKIAGIGIALPAIYAHEAKTIITAPLIGVRRPTSMEDHIRRLEMAYGVPVMVENDTNAQSIGEFRSCGMSADQDMVFISAGTGLGAGVILKGKLRRGQNNMSGEIGYFSFSGSYTSKPDHPGWLEDRVGYQRLEDRYGVNTKTDLTTLPEKMLQLILEELAAPLALCVNNIIMLLDCGAVHMGGIVVTLLGDRLIDSVNRRLERLCINPVQVKMQSNEDIGLIGTSSPLTRSRVNSLLTLEDTQDPKETG